jgi:hypothetical protein
MFRQGWGGRFLRFLAALDHLIRHMRSMLSTIPEETRGEDQGEDQYRQKPSGCTVTAWLNSGAKAKSTSTTSLLFSR